MRDYRAHSSAHLKRNPLFSTISRRGSGGIFVIPLRLFVGAGAFFAAGHSTMAQSSVPAATPPRLDEMVVTATRVEEASHDLPYATTVLDRDFLDARSFRTMPDALREESSV